LQRSIGASAGAAVQDGNLNGQEPASIYQNQGSQMNQLKEQQFNSAAKFSTDDLNIHNKRN